MTADMGNINQVISTILSHRSIRSYRKASIPKEHVELIEKAAQRAPTDATLHLWTAIRIDDHELKSRIAGMVGQKHIEEASLFYIYLADLHRLYKILEYRGVPHSRDDYALLIFAAIDAALAAENMAIAAESMGYGTCFIGAIQNSAEELIKILELPVKTYPLFGLTIGVPGEDPPIRPRLPIDMLIHVNKYKVYSEDDMENGIKIMNKITRTRDWIRVISRYASSGGYFERRAREMRRLLELQGFSGLYRDAE